MLPTMTPTMIRDLRNLIEPEPLVPVPMTARAGPPSWAAHV